jgi:hypothetical protein
MIRLPEERNGACHDVGRQATAARCENPPWQAYRSAAGTMLGFLDVMLPSDMIINGCKLMVGANAKHWIALPAQPQTGRDHSAKLTPAKSPSGRG